MLTPQDIESKEFVKAVFGGYDMATVDDFLEEINESYTAVFKENALLKNKIKVLVEKVEEYRSTEDAMRMALLSAQRTGEEILNEARKKSDDLLANAERAAQEKVGDLRFLVEEEENRLYHAKEKTVEFIGAMKGYYEKQLDFLSGLNELKLSKPQTREAREPEPEPEQELDDTARAIERSVSKILKEEEENALSQESQNKHPFSGATDEKKSPAAMSAFGERVDEPLNLKTRLNFENLQFGSNYDQEKK